MYVDVYGRDIDKGDVVVVAQYHSTIKESIYVVGPEMYMKDKYICYKLTEPPKGQKNRIKDNIDCLGWSLVPGDLVFLGFKGTKIIYGLVIGKGKYMIMTGRIMNFKVLEGLKIFTLCEEELEIKKKLVDKYNKLMSIKSATLGCIHSIQKVQKGEVYLTADNSYVYIYLGPCGYIIDYMNKKGKVFVTTKTPRYNDDVFVRLSYKLDYTKKFIDRIKSGEVVKLQEVIQNINFREEDDIYVCPFWDKELVEQLVRLSYLPFTSKNWYTSWLSCKQHLSVGEQISRGHQSLSGLVMKSYAKISRNTVILGHISLDKSVCLVTTDKVKVTMYL